MNFQLPHPNNLHLADLDPDPVAQFAQWYQQARANNLLQPDAMSLATVDDEGNVSSRLVLLRSYNDDGFVFFTGMDTKKVAAITVNPKVALLFSWLQLQRQVRIEGTAVPLNQRETLKFFVTRRRESQLGAWLTQSSQIVTSRQVLQAKMHQIKRKFRNGRIPLPDKWGGYRVKPHRFEFWQASPDGLHDRFEYTQNSQQQWAISRLSP